MAGKDRQAKAWTGQYRDINSKSGTVMNNGLHELFLEELADMYDAEQQLVKALPKLAKAAKGSQLRKAFESHLKETENHVERLKEVFESLDEKPKKKACKGLSGIIKEGEEMLEDHKGAEEGDAALICAAQKAEHYEIASYGCLSAWAEQMGHEEAVDILEEILAEEKEADEKLTQIAKSSANPQAT
jgi:ferritin-like metal-binding protein YciE